MPDGRFDAESGRCALHRKIRVELMQISEQLQYAPQAHELFILTLGEVKTTYFCLEEESFSIRNTKIQFVTSKDDYVVYLVCR